MIRGHGIRAIALFFSSLLFVVSQTPVARAASCCGGGGGLPGIITGDFRNTSTVSGSQSHVIGDTDSQGNSLFRNDSNNEVTQTFAIDETWLVSSRWQAGGSIPWVRRTREIGSKAATDSGLGDPRAFGAWEFLPETEYSVWKPRGFLYLAVSAPLAPSRYDFGGQLNEDIRGKGFWIPAVGNYYLKIRGRWDFLAGVELHQGLPREFRRKDGQTFFATPALGGSALLGAGFSPKSLAALRTGITLSPSYEGQVAFSNAGSSTPAQVWDLGVSLSYLLSNSFSVSANYTDQTVFGPASNTTLARTILLSLQNRSAL